MNNCRNSPIEFSECLLTYKLKATLNHLIELAEYESFSVEINLLKNHKSSPKTFRK